MEVMSVEFNGDDGTPYFLRSHKAKSFKKQNLCNVSATLVSSMPNDELTC